MLSLFDAKQNQEMFANSERAEGRAEGKSETERENVLSAIREGLPKETIIRVFKITPEKYAKYLAML